MRPRLAVFRSARHIYVQAIDDDQGNTLACSSTLAIQKSLKKIYSGNKHWDGFELSFKYSYMVG